MISLMVGASAVVLQSSSAFAAPDGSADIAPTSGPPGTQVVVDVVCGDPQFESRLSVQFRSAGEAPRDPFADPRLPIDVLESPSGNVRVAVSVPDNAPSGDAVFDILCLNAEGGGIPGLSFSVPFAVTGLAATGGDPVPMAAASILAVALGMVLMVSASVRRTGQRDRPAS